jgi:WD40 repeat protein
MVCVAVSPDGKIVASAGEDCYLTHRADPVIRLWDAATGKELRQCRGHVIAPGRLLFSPDGKILASQAAVGMQDDETVRLWDVGTGKQLHVLEHGVPTGGRQWLRNGLAFSPDGRMLASSGGDRTIRLWDVATGKELRCWTEPRPSQGLVFSPDGKALAFETIESLSLLEITADEPRQTKLCDCPTGAEALQFSPDGKIIVSGTYVPELAADGKTSLRNKCTGVIHWWDRASGKELRHIEGSPLASSPDGNLLAIRQQEAVLLWDMTAGKEVRRLPLKDLCRPTAGREQFVGSLSADGGMLVVPDGGMIRILDTTAAKEQHTHPGHSDDVLFTAFSPDGSRLISAADRSVRFWDPHTGKQVGELRGPEYSICGASMTGDGRMLAAGTERCMVHLWDLGTGRELRQLAVDGPADHPTPALAPDGRTVAVKGGPRALGIQLFDVATGKELRHFGFGNQTDGLAFLPDGSAVADVCSTIELFDCQSGKPLRTLLEQSNGARRAGMAFSPDSRVAATGYPDRAHGKVGPMDMVSLWEVASGSFIAQFRGHEGMVVAFTFAHSGRVVASGGWDGTVRLWDLPTGRELRKFEGHRGGVLSLAFSPDDKLLASGGSDTSILIWDVANFTAKRPLPAVRLSGADLEKLWTELGADSAQAGYRALWQLAAGGKPAVDFLKEALGPNPPPEQTVKKLIADLDSEEFEVRERATGDLSDLGRLAQPALQKALGGNPSAEMRRRLLRLLDKLQNPARGRAPEELRQLRAVQALEYGGSSEARELLETLAQKEPDSALGVAAKAALKRLVKQRP